MLNVYYNDSMYKDNLKKIDSEEGLCICDDLSRIREVVGDHPKRIQKVMGTHNINLTIDECVGLYHSWSTSTRNAVWLTTINDMDDNDLYKVMSSWLLTVAADNISRLMKLQHEVFNASL